MDSFAKQPQKKKKKRKAKHACSSFAVTCIDWSDDSNWLVAGSKDGVTRIFSTTPREDFQPARLSAHKQVNSRVHRSSGLSCLGNQVIEFHNIRKVWGHSLVDTFRQAVVRCFFAPNSSNSNQVITISRDGALFKWAAEEKGNYSSQWKQSSKFFFSQRNAELTAADLFHRQSTCFDNVSKGWHPDHNAYAHTCADGSENESLVVAGFSSGVFGIYQLSSMEQLHLLSASQESISSVCFNRRGDWLAIGCASLGQLIVWEWRSETYISKQQGHSSDIQVPVLFYPCKIFEYICIHLVYCTMNNRTDFHSWTINRHDYAYRQLPFLAMDSILRQEEMTQNSSYGLSQLGTAS